MAWKDKLKNEVVNLNVNVAVQIWLSHFVLCQKLFISDLCGESNIIFYHQPLWIVAFMKLSRKQMTGAIGKAQLTFKIPMQ